jgi:DNA-binding IclR family transcriptional regulator
MAQSNKTKFALRMIEVLDFFHGGRRQASVMDIARCYGRPQSSTSELLANLVELGFLYRDERSRLYTLTPRVALLGTAFQPERLRDGKVLGAMSRITAETGWNTALVGMVGTRAQVFHWVGASGAEPGALGCGSAEPLSDGVAGLLLLGTLSMKRRVGLLHRLNAEACRERKFSHPETLAQVTDFSRQGYAIGKTTLAPAGLMCAVLLPQEADERPLVLSAIGQPAGGAEPLQMLARLRAAVGEREMEPARRAVA